MMASQFCQKAYLHEDFISKMTLKHKDKFSIKFMILQLEATLEFQTHGTLSNINTLDPNYTNSSKTTSGVAQNVKNPRSSHI